MLVPIAEYANGDTEAMTVVEAEHTSSGREHGEDADALPSSIHGGGVFEREPRGDEAKRPNDGSASPSAMRPSAATTRTHFRIIRARRAGGRPRMSA
jgi:hypothetical protein